MLSVNPMIFSSLLDNRTQKERECDKKREARRIRRLEEEKSRKEEEEKIRKRKRHIVLLSLSKSELVKVIYRLEQRLEDHKRAVSNLEQTFRCESDPFNKMNEKEREEYWRQRERGVW